MTGLSNKSRRGGRQGRLLSLAFLLLGAAIALFTWQSYLHKKADITASAEERLRSIADLKVRLIADWRDDRLNEEPLGIQATPFIATAVREFFNAPDDLPKRAQLLTWMKAEQKSEGYKRVLLLDAQLAVRLAVPEQNTRLGQFARTNASAALHSSHIVISDIHLSNVVSNVVSMDVLVPIILSAGPEAGPSPEPMAVVLLEIDPRDFLFPFIQQWPTPSRTAETLLVRQEGDEIVFLNELRHRRDSALKLRFPISAPDLPAARAVRGEEGITEGLDYRGVPVLTATRRIPDSPWFMVAKVDQAEVYAPIRQGALASATTGGALILVTGLCLLLVWREREGRFVRQQLALAGRVAHVVKMANDIILLTDENWKIVEANERAVEKYGYSLAELLRMNLRDLRAPEARAAFEDQVAQIDRRNGTLLETVHQRKGGSTFPVETSVRAIAVDGQHLHQSIIRDITERKAHEREIERLNRLYAALSEVNQAIVRIPTTAELHPIVCRDLVEFGGFQMAWIGLVNPDTHEVAPLAKAGDESGYLDDPRVFADDRPEGQGPTGMAIREARSYICNDFFKDPCTAPWRKAADKAGFRASAAFPLRQRGQIIGALSVYAREIGFFGEKEIALLEEVAMDVSFALDHLENETRRLKAEKALRESQALYHSFVEQQPAAVFRKDHEGRYDMVNSQFCRLKGLKAEDFLGKKPVEVAGTEPAKRVRSGQATKYAAQGEDAHERIMRTGETIVTEEEYPAENGGRQFMHVVRMPVLGPDGRIIGTQGMLFDVTDRKRTEQRLADTLDYGRTILDTSPVGIVTCKASGQVMSANPEVLRIIGGTLEQVQTQNFRQLESWKSSGLLAAAEMALATGQPRHLETHLESTFGRQAWVSVRFTPFIHEGEPYLLAILTDISQRKQAEEAQARLATAVEQAAESILITDTTGTILYVNPAFEKVTGYARQEAVGQNPRILKSGRQDAAFYRQMWETLLRGEVWSGHLINRKKNGSLCEQEATISPVHNAAGKVVNYVGVQRDVTQEVALEAQLRQSQKMEAIGQLSGGVAHDFNNILTIIQGNATLLLMDKPTETDLKESAQQIVQATERAANLTRQLLMFSRKQVIKPVNLDLNGAVGGMTKMLHRILGEDVTLRFESTPGLPLIFADAGMIEQVVLNLAVNSRDAMPKGGQLTIATGTETVEPNQALTNPDAVPGPCVSLTITDTGCGIPPEVLPRIFEPFFTTKEVGKGTGLGLATVYGIVKQHRGWIETTSKPGQGTSFRIFFPAVLAPRAETETEAASPALPRGTETILVVEDDLSLRLLVTSLLQRCGYTVLPAVSGVAALDVWNQHKDRIQLLLTDLVMPDGMTGLDLADRLKAAKPQLKVIYTSGYSAELSIRGHALVEGVDFLQKPYAPVKLAQMIRTRLNQG